MLESIEKLKRTIKTKYGNHELPKPFAKGETIDETMEKAIANVGEMGVGGGIAWSTPKETIFQYDQENFSLGELDNTFDDKPIGTIFKVTLEWVDSPNYPYTINMYDDYCSYFDVYLAYDSETPVSGIYMQSGQFQVGSIVLFASDYDENAPTNDVKLSIQTLQLNGVDIDSTTLLSI